MGDAAAKLGVVYTERALQAAGATQLVLFLCRECDYSWKSPAPTRARCEMCGRICRPQQGCSVFDPLKVTNPQNFGLAHTNYETAGLG